MSFTLTGFPGFVEIADSNTGLSIYPDRSNTVEVYAKNDAVQVDIDGITVYQDVYTQFIPTGGNAQLTAQLWKTALVTAFCACPTSGNTDVDIHDSAGGTVLSQDLALWTAGASRSDTTSGLLNAGTSQFTTSVGQMTGRYATMSLTIENVLNSSVQTFVVERSVDGINYTIIGDLKNEENGALVDSIDETMFDANGFATFIIPVAGAYYIRFRQISYTVGSFVLIGVMSAVIEPQTSIGIYQGSNQLSINSLGQVKVLEESIPFTQLFNDGADEFVFETDLNYYTLFFQLFDGAAPGVMTLIVETTNDNTDPTSWTPQVMFYSMSPTPVFTATALGQYSAIPNGKYVRIRVLAYTSGEFRAEIYLSNKQLISAGDFFSAFIFNQLNTGTVAVTLSGGSPNTDSGFIPNGSNDTIPIGWKKLTINVIGVTATIDIGGAGATVIQAGTYVLGDGFTAKTEAVTLTTGVADTITFIVEN